MWRDLGALFVVSAASASAGGCRSAGDRGAPAPDVTSPASASAIAPAAPPAWTSPENAAPPLPWSSASVSPDLAKARAFAEAGEPKRVRATLEKKLKAGKLSRQEAVLLADACVVLRDRACIDAVHAKYPEL
jgi:hypothetical protein